MSNKENMLLRQRFGLPLRAVQAHGKNVMLENIYKYANICKCILCTERKIKEKES